jgi:hypothetical protein
MIGHFRTVDPGQVRHELVLIEARARAGRGVHHIQVRDLTIRCLMGPARDPEGRIGGLEPVFDAIYFAPDYSWRCGKFDEIRFTGDINEMERWLEARRGVIAPPAPLHESIATPRRPRGHVSAVIFAVIVTAWVALADFIRQSADISSARATVIAFMALAVVTAAVIRVVRR